MKLTILLSFILLIAQNIFAQISFVKYPDLGTTKDYVYDLIPASDGGYVFTGYVGESDDILKTKLIIGKFDEYGDTVWTKRYGEMVALNCGYAIAATSDGGYIVGGTKANKAAWLLRFNANGDTLWTKELATGELHDVIVTSKGEFAVCGNEKSNLGNIQILIAITDANGTLQYSNVLGDIYYQDIHAIVELPSGNFFVGGSTNGQGAGNFDVYAVKFNKEAVALWDTTYGSTSSDRAYDMILDSNGDLVFGGSTNRNSDLEDLMIKIDTLGNKIWEHTYTTSVTNTIYDIHEASKGSYIGAGVFYESQGYFGLRPCMLRTNNDGEQICLNEYNGVNYMESFVFTALEVDNGEILLVGSGYNATFIRTDSRGFIASDKYLKNELQAEIYPNPTSDIINIQVASGDYQIKLFNTNGQYVYSLNINAQNNIQVDLTPYSKGIYLLDISGNTKHTSLKIIKK